MNREEFKARVDKLNDELEALAKEYDKEIDGNVVVVFAVGTKSDISSTTHFSSLYKGSPLGLYHLLEMSNKNLTNTIGILNRIEKSTDH